MSYWLRLTDPVTNEVLEVKEKHFIAGGTYQVGGSNELELNVTYNYCKYYYGDDKLGEDGLKGLEGMTGATSIPLLERAISHLGDDVCDDYWMATEGNAKRALCGILALAQMRPDGIWKID